jgi:hypothetical protein
MSIAFSIDDGLVENNPVHMVKLPEETGHDRSA